MSQTLIEMAPATFPLSYINVDVYYFFFKSVGPNPLKRIYLKENFYRQKRCTLFYVVYAKKLSVITDPFKMRQSDLLY